MTDNKEKIKSGFSFDWLVQGALTKLGDTFDRLTGRNWKPSSSLATSELIERLKKLLDAEVHDAGEKGRLVPHNIKLKMQWDKFATDSEQTLKTLENELSVAVINHINDRKYHTFAPLRLEVKPDYFTEGVQFLTSFDNFLEVERDAAVRVTLPDIKINDLLPPEKAKLTSETAVYYALFSIGDTSKQTKLTFEPNRRFSVGRTKENDLTLDDASVSKIHASLTLGGEAQILLADTGSTNGTFVNGERIAYGKAVPIKEGDRVNFGTIAVTFEPAPVPVALADEKAASPENSFMIDGFEFKTKNEFSEIGDDGGKFDETDEPERQLETARDVSGVE